MTESADFSQYPKHRGPDRREHGDDAAPRLKLTPAQFAQLAVWLVSIVLAYGALSERITRLEERYDRLVADVAEMKADVKQLLRIAAKQQP